MSQDFPVLFSVGTSSRHEVILINPGSDLQELSERIQGLVASSVNCEEPLAKYKKKGEAEKVTSIKVRWATEGRDTKLFPKSTVLTHDNCEAVLTLISRNGGKDILEVDMEAPESSKKEESKKEAADSKELPERQK